MALTNLGNSEGAIGPLRDKLTVAIGTDDYVNNGGFICQVVTAGSLTYRTLEGAADATESGLSAGDVINVGGIPVVLRAVRGSSTVTSIVIGRL